MTKTQAADSDAVRCNGNFYRMWTISTPAVVLVILSLFLGACDQQVQPEKNQSGQKDSAGQQESQEVGGRQDSLTARSGPGAYTTLTQLPPPEPFSEDAGLRNMNFEDNGDLYAHPPSGATFTIKNEGRPVSVEFTPSFISDVPAEKTDGVTFKVWSGKERLYKKHVLPDDPTSAVTLDLPEARTEDAVRLSFVTSVGPSGDEGWDWALWRDVRIVVGKGEQATPSAPRAVSGEKTEEKTIPAATPATKPPATATATATATP